MVRSMAFQPKFEFYRKVSPNTPLFIAGKRIQFTRAVTWEIGIYATNDKDIREGINDMIEKGRGGVFHITEEEFHAFHKKKLKKGLDRWRDNKELGNLSTQSVLEGLMRSQANPRNAAVARNNQTESNVGRGHSDNTKDGNDHVRVKESPQQALPIPRPKARAKK